MSSMPRRRPRAAAFPTLARCGIINDYYLVERSQDGPAILGSLRARASDTSGSLQSPTAISCRAASSPLRPSALRLSLHARLWRAAPRRPRPAMRQANRRASQNARAPGALPDTGTLPKFFSHAKARARAQAQPAAPLLTLSRAAQGWIQGLGTGWGSAGHSRALGDTRAAHLLCHPRPRTGVAAF